MGGNFTLRAGEPFVGREGGRGSCRVLFRIGLTSGEVKYRRCFN